MAALQQQNTMPEWSIYHLTFHRKTLPTHAVDKNLSLRGAYSLFQTDNKKINILEWWWNIQLRIRKQEKGLGIVVGRSEKAKSQRWPRSRDLRRGEGQTVRQSGETAAAAAWGGNLRELQEAVCGRVWGRGCAAEPCRLLREAGLLLRVRALVCPL